MLSEDPRPDAPARLPAVPLAANRVERAPDGAGAQRGLLLALGVAAFMVSLDARVVAPLLPTLARDFGVSMAQAAWAVSSYMLPYGLFQLAYGPLADRYGKVRVATYAMLAFSVGTACSGIFPSFAALLTLRALTGAAAAALIPLTIAYIGDTVPYGRRQATLALLMASTGAAQAFSMSLGGLIAAVVSWRAVFPILGALAAAATLGVFLFRKRELRPVRDPEVAPARYRDALRRRDVRGLLASVFVEGVLFTGGFSFVSGLLEARFGLGSLAIGAILSSLGLAQLVAARLIPGLLRRGSERRLLGFGGAAMGTAFWLVAASPHWSFTLVACVLLGAGFSLCHSTLQTRATEALPSARGSMLALFAFSLFSGSGVGSVCFGLSVELLGYSATFAAGGLGLLAFTAVLVRRFANPVRSERPC